MNELLQKKTSKAPVSTGALAIPKSAVDALLTELARPGAGATYDRKWQTGGNPFADSRDKDVAVPQAPDPLKTSKIDLSTGEVDGQERTIAPEAHDKKILSDSTQKSMKDDREEDGMLLSNASHYGSLNVSDHNYDFESDQNHRIANKVASNRYFRQYVTTANVKVHDDILMLNIPRGKVAQAEFGPTEMSRMEREISAALHVRAKYAHTVISSGFDGISFEFMLV